MASGPTGGQAWARTVSSDIFFRKKKEMDYLNYLKLKTNITLELNDFNFHVPETKEKQFWLAEISSMNTFVMFVFLVRDILYFTF